MTQRDDDAPESQPINSDDEPEPEEETADDKPKPEEDAKDRAHTSVLGSIGQIAGASTAVVGTIYALGMLTLLLPIYNAYDTTFATAWYMVSLIPKTTVAGYGAKSLLWPSLATVLPMAFITVLVLTVFSLLWVAIRHAARHAKSAKNEILRGVLFTMAVYAGYSTLQGAVTTVMYVILRSVDSELSHVLLRYNNVAASLAYGIFAVLSALTLLLLTLSGVIAIAKLARAKASRDEYFQTFGSLKVSLYLALCVGMVCAVIAGLNLVHLGFFSVEILDPEANLSFGPLEIVWLDVLLSLIILIPMVLLLLLADRALPSKMLGDGGPILGVAIYSCRIFSIVVTVGTALLVIADIFIFGLGLGGMVPTSRPPAMLREVEEISIFLIIYLLTPCLVLLWSLGTLIPSTVRGIPGHKVRMLLAISVMGSVIMSAAAYVVISYMGNTGFRKDTFTWLDVTLFTISIILGVAGAATVLILLVRASVRLMQRTGTQNVVRERLESMYANFSLRLKNSVSDNSLSMLRFAGAFFILFYLALAVVCLYTWYIVHPLYININSISRSRSSLDELFVRLSLVGGILSGMLLYYGGLTSQSKENSLLSARSWRSFLGSLRRSVLHSSIRREFVWALGGAYVFSLIVASLIAFLEPPPLPRVNVAIEKNSSLQKILPSESETLGSQPDTKRLLAHTDGYWYLFDEHEKQLLILPDGNDFAIWFPHFVDIANSTGAFKTEVPVAWDEVQETYHRRKENKELNPNGYDYADLIVSRNVDHWQEGYGAESGARITVKPGLSSKEDIKEDIDRYVNDPDPGCKNFLGQKDHEVHAQDADLKGKVARWTDCGSDGSTVIIVAAASEDRGFVVKLEIDIPKGEAEDVDHILKSFWVDTTRLTAPG